MATNDNDIRAQIVDMGRQLYQSGLITDSSGNISLFDRKKEVIAVTRSGASCQLPQC